MLLLLLLLVFELLLLQLVLTLLLGLLVGLLLTCFNIELVLRGLGLLPLESLLFLLALRGLLRTLPTRFLELALVVALLLVVGLLIGRRLRRRDTTLRLIERMSIGIPATSCTRVRYARALAGSLSHSLMPTVLSFQPAKRS